MPIADDWNFDYANKVISHIDGVLAYDGGSGTQPIVGSYIRGATSGAIGKILARTGDQTSGTFTLTNVIGKFQDDENLSQLSLVDFDGIGNGGFKVGDTIVDQVSGSMVVRFIEYNIDGTAGHGTAYGDTMSAFTDDSQIDISGGQSAVAVADGTGTDNDAAWSGVVNLTLKPAGTTDTNNCEIIHYDNGTIDIPEDAHIADTTGLTGAEGYAQRVFGSTSQGSIRVIDSDTSSANWVNNNSLYIHDVVYYDTLVAGKVFSEGDVIKAVNGTTPNAEGRVLAVIDDGDNTGKLILAGFSGTWQDDNEIHVLQDDDTYVKYGEVENTTNKYLDAADVNIPDGVRTEQREDQGGIFGSDYPSLNLIRSANAFYSLAQDLFDELGQLDDDPALFGDVRDQLYTILNDYVIPDLSMRFIEKGSFKDSGNNNVFTNVQSTGAIADIGDHGFFYSTSNPTPQPDFYIEQDGEVIRSDWLEGPLDMLIKTKTSTDPAYINPNVEALGQLINGGAFTVHLRPYRRTYDSNEVTQVGGIAVVALGNANDLNNTTGQYQADYTGTGGFTIGEEAVTSDGKRVVIMAEDTTGDTVDYALKSATNLANSDVITGVVSGATATVSGAPSNLVAGYGTNIRNLAVNLELTGGTTTVSNFILGEVVTQSGTSATGYFLEDDGGDIYLEHISGTFNGTGQLTGGTSGALNTPTGITNPQTLVPKDIGGGVGDKNYKVVVCADMTNSNARPVAEVYEWWKFVTRRENTSNVVMPGNADDVQGRIYRRLDSGYAEVRGASPYGTKAGSLVIGAQGVFIEKGEVDSGDIRNIQLIDDLGDTYDPPNLQVLEMINLTNGVRGAVYRSTGEGNEAILRNEFLIGTVGTNNQAADSIIEVKAGGARGVSPLPNDVPDEGVLRVLDPNDTGNYLRFPYSSVDRTNNEFTLASGTIGDVTGATDLTEGDNAHVVFIEEESTGASVNNTIQYVADIYLFAVARIKGKQPFKTTATFGTTGASIGANLNADNVVNLP
jgi:hypothetical protein